MNVIKTYDVVQKKLKYSNIVKDRAECHKASTLSNSILGGTGIKYLFQRISMPRETTVYIFQPKAAFQKTVHEENVRIAINIKHY